jgi:hypothetical protein
MGKSTAIDAPVEYKQVCQAKRDPIFKWRKSKEQESYGKELTFVIIATSYYFSTITETIVNYSMITNV